MTGLKTISGLIAWPAVVAGGVPILKVGLVRGGMVVNAWSELLIESLEAVICARVASDLTLRVSLVAVGLATLKADPGRGDMAINLKLDHRCIRIVVKILINNSLRTSAVSLPLIVTL